MQVPCSAETPDMQGPSSAGSPAMQNHWSTEIPLSGDLARADPRPAPHLCSRSARRDLWEGRLHGAGHRAGRSLPVGPHGRPMHTCPQRPHFPHLHWRIPRDSNAAALAEVPPGSAPCEVEIEDLSSADPRKYRPSSVRGCGAYGRVLPLAC